MHKRPIILVFLFFLVHIPISLAGGFGPYFHIEGLDENFDQFPLKGTRTEVSIIGVIARVTIVQSYANLGSQTIHAKYIFPGSTTAAVTGMTMTIGERVIRAKIKEKEEAKKIFEAAKQAGKNASLLQQQRPNVFATDVANIMPGDTIDVELTYTELIVPDKGVYEFVYPAVVGPRYGGADAKFDPGQQWIANPYLQEGVASPASFDFKLSINAPMRLQELSSSSHKLQPLWNSDNSATVLIDPSDVDPGNRDFILRYRLNQGEIVSGLMRYEGEDENYFLLMAEPPARVRPDQVPAREYIFVVDVSGSMSGFPLDVSKAMLREFVGKLKPTDTFNILFFSGGSKLLSPRSLYSTEDNLNKALYMLTHQRGGGGTELLAAMERALDLPKDEDAARSIVILTDGYIGAERAVFQKIRSSLNNTNVFALGIGSSVNRYLIEGITKSGNGETFIVTNQNQSRQIANDFVDYIESPVLTNIALNASGVEVYDVEPVVFSDMLSQRPVLVFGKYRNARQRPAIKLTGLTEGGEYASRFAFDRDNVSEENMALRWLWARKRISALSDHYWNDPKENRDEIFGIGLKYSLLTRYTSFVAVDEVVRNPGGLGRNVKQPLPLPAGVSNQTVGGPRRVSEPPLMIMAGLLLMMSLLTRRGNRHG